MPKTRSQYKMTKTNPERDKSDRLVAAGLQSDKPETSNDGQQRDSKTIPRSLMQVECAEAVLLSEANINIGGRMTKTRVCSKGHAVYKGNHYQNKPHNMNLRDQ